MKTKNEQILDNLMKIVLNINHLKKSLDNITLDIEESIKNVENVQKTLSHIDMRAKTMAQDLDMIGDQNVDMIECKIMELNDTLDSFSCNIDNIPLGVGNYDSSRKERPYRR